MADGENNITEWVEQRGSRPGRRDTDRNQCAMHDFMQNKNDHCFDIIKNTIKEEVLKRDHKFEVLENRLENFISKWSVGIILSVSVSLLGALVGIGLWQMQTMHQELAGISDQVTGVKLSIRELSVNQKRIYQQYEDLTPEHKRLMNHMQRSEDLMR